MRFRFGPFDVDTAQGRLLKHGIPVRLREQPFQVLAALLEHPGETVTREELRLRLWGGNTFVDFDAGLHAAISRLRQALGDSARTPRWIETASKRGYRFIGLLRHVVPAADDVKLEGGGNGPARTAYMKGHHLVARHTPEAFEKAFAYFEEAIRIDPSDPLPYHGAALVLILRCLLDDLAPGSALPEADEFLRRGFGCGTDCCQLHNTLGTLRMFQWRWAEAELAYQRALGMEPNNAYAHMMYAVHCSFLGRHEQAMAEARAALQLDPLYPMTNFRMVQCSYYARRYADCLAYGQEALELSPGPPQTRWYMALALTAMDRRDEAFDLTRQLMQENTRQGVEFAMCGYVAGMSGQHEVARRMLEELRARRERAYCPAVALGWVHLGLGETGECLRWLGTAYREGDPYLASIRVFPAYDPIRNDRRFRSLLGRVTAATTVNGRRLP